MIFLDEFRDASLTPVVSAHADRVVAVFSDADGRYATLTGLLVGGSIVHLTISSERDGLEISAPLEAFLADAALADLAYRLASDAGVSVATPL